MSQPDQLTRRDFLNQSLAAAAAVTTAAALGAPAAAQPSTAPATGPTASVSSIPLGTIGKAKISRLLIGGNLIAGYLHSRDLHYVTDLFRAYATDRKILETLALAEKYGINTVFESGGTLVNRYNRENNGHMQFIPHIEVDRTKTEQQLKDHIQQQVDTGAVALYVWGVAADRLVAANEVGLLGRTVELAKLHNLPVGVGGHSLLVPMACENYKVPCDFYVKTLHSDKYPSATPKELRTEFMWNTNAKGYYDNMWCINPEETIAFMKTVTKPWVAFKVLAAGAFYPREGFNYAFQNGADFIAVGMFDFQVKQNCALMKNVLRQHEQRERPWRA
jgi:hypothetical protein